VTNKPEILNFKKNKREKMKKRIFQQLLEELFGITNPRIVASLTDLLDAKFTTGAVNLDTVKSEMSAQVIIWIDGKPTTLSITASGPLVQQADAIFKFIDTRAPIVPVAVKPIFAVEKAIPLKEAIAPVIMQITPSTKEPDFLGPK
jgi:hypothetical protein